MKTLSYELITSVSTLVMAIIAILAFFVAIQTKNEWKLAKRYEAFHSYYEKMAVQKKVSFEILGAIQNFKKQPLEHRENLENFNSFKNMLGNICLNYIEKSSSSIDDIFNGWMNKTTSNAVKEMRDAEIELSNVLDLQNWKSEKDIKYSEIENKLQKVIDAIDKVMFEAAKSLKNKRTIKL